MGRSGSFETVAAGQNIMSGVLFCNCRYIFGLGVGKYR